MWGSWLGLTVSGLAAVLLLIAVVATGFTPIFGILIAAIAIVGIGIVFATRGGRQETDAGASQVAEAPAADEPEHRPRERSGSEVAGGIWGEKREA